MDITDKRRRKQLRPAARDEMNERCNCLFGGVRIQKLDQSRQIFLLARQISERLKARRRSARESVPLSLQVVLPSS